MHQFQHINCPSYHFRPCLDVIKSKTFSRRAQDNIPHLSYLNHDFPRSLFVEIAVTVNSFHAGLIDVPLIPPLTF